MIKCRYCKRKMDLAEFLTYAEAYLIKTLVVATAIPLLVAIMKQYFSVPTKGFIDSKMAGLANNFSIVCPSCKRADQPWDSAPERKEAVIENRESNSIL